MSRPAWDDMMRRRMIPSLFQLMAFQASSIVYTGQGKVGSENGHAPVPFQISQRADFIETLVGEQTTFNRPLVNTRDEPLCGRAGSAGGEVLPGSRYARLHVIFYDTNRAPVATYLKVGVMQLFLAMLEARELDDSLVLEDPLAALHGWSHDPDLELAMPLRSGQQLTAVELQMKFLEQARAFDASGGFDGIVCGAGEILALWEDTLNKLESRAYGELRGRIDWIMKRSILEAALGEHPDWCWESPELRYLDQIYASLDPADGAFLALQEAGLFEPVATEAEIDHYMTNPPADTRAWTRAMLLRAVEPARVAHVDWDRIELRATGGRGLRTHIGLADPLSANRALAQSIFTGAKDLPDLLEALQDAGAVTLKHSQIQPVSALNRAVECYDPLTYNPD
jgi:proteasome accessory factor A